MEKKLLNFIFKGWKVILYATPFLFVLAILGRFNFLGLDDFVKYNYLGRFIFLGLVGVFIGFMVFSAPVLAWYSKRDFSGYDKFSSFLLGNFKKLRENKGIYFLYFVLAIAMVGLMGNIFGWSIKQETELSVEDASFISTVNQRISDFEKYASTIPPQVEELDKMINSSNIKLLQSLDPTKAGSMLSIIEGYKQAILQAENFIQSSNDTLKDLVNQTRKDSSKLQVLEDSYSDFANQWLVLRQNVLDNASRMESIRSNN